MCGRDADYRVLGPNALRHTHRTVSIARQWLPDAFAVGLWRGSRLPALCNWLSNGGNTLGRYDHDGLAFGIVGGLVFSDGFILALVFVVRHDLAYPFLIPALRE